MKTNDSDDWLNVKGVAEIIPDCFVVWTAATLAMDARGQERAAESKLRRKALWSSWVKSRVRGKSGLAHRVRLDQLNVRVITASSNDRDEHIAMVLNVLLSQEYDILSATVTTTEGDGYWMAGSPLGGQRKICRVLLLSMDPELLSVCKENLSLAAAVNEY